MSPRPLTQAEQAEAKQCFPHANVAAMMVIGPKSETYNCLAWSLNVLNAWIWPWNHSDVKQTEFDSLYVGRGFAVAGGAVHNLGDVAGYGISLNDMKHGASVYNGGWTSKLGAWLLVTHTLADLIGPNSIYGFVKHYYTHPHNVGSIDNVAIDDSAELELEELDEREVKLLRNRLSSIPVNVKQEFEHRYNSWRETWFDENNIMLSDPRSRRRSQTFERLINMGSEIVPLLIDRLQYPSDFFAMQALEIFIAPELVYYPELGSPDILMGEQGRARRTIKRWLLHG